MEISTLNQTSTENAGQPAQSRNALSSDFETFLLMMTTQMENQDPLNPIESSDFAVQLATFSGVEQQVRTNELLARLAGDSAMSDLASWVGLNARVGGAVNFDGAPVQIDIGAARPDNERQLIVRSEGGNVVSREPLDGTIGLTDWAGLDANGRPLAAGRYILNVEYLQDGEVVDRLDVEHFSTVVEARKGGSGIELVLANGATVASEEVTALRDGS